MREKKNLTQHWQFHQSIFDLQLTCKCLDTLFSRCITIHNRGLLRETAESLTCTLLNPCNPESEAASIAKIRCRGWGEVGFFAIGVEVGSVANLGFGFALHFFRSAPQPLVTSTAYQILSLFQFLIITMNYSAPKKQILVDSYL